MGWLSDALKFEGSKLSDMWSGLKKDPKRAVLGVDPLSTGAWNAVLGRNDEPIVGDFGGPTEQNYENAEARGINTGSSRALHGVARTIASMYGAQGVGGAFGGGAGGAWDQGFSGTSGVAGAPYGSNPAAGIGGIAGPVGGSAGTGANWAKYASLGNAGAAPQQAGPMDSGPPMSMGRTSMGGTRSPQGTGPSPVGTEMDRRALLAKILRTRGGF